MLVGLMTEGNSVAAVALANLGVELTRVRTTIEVILGAGGRISSGTSPLRCP